MEAAISEAIRDAADVVSELKRQRDAAFLERDQLRDLLAIAVQRHGGQMVVVDDDVPNVYIHGNVVTTRRTQPARMWQTLAPGKDVGKGQCGFTDR